MDLTTASPVLTGLPVPANPIFESARQSALREGPFTWRAGLQHPEQELPALGRLDP